MIAVSEFTKRELLELLDVPEEKVRVIPNAVGPPFSPEGESAPGDYVLAVSTLEPRKNLPRLVEAYRARGPERPAAAGRRRGRLGRRAGRAATACAGSARSATTSWPGSTAARGRVAYVSLYEGFGLPVLEAMACGAPVVAARTGALEEVAGGAAVLVDPLDPDAIAAGLAEAIERRDELRPLGLERARAFDWREVARADGRRVPRSRGMSDPLVVIDADVLGRQRTGDETYVRSLLRELAAAAPSDLRLAAITRRPDLVPDGIEPVELPARSQVARMAFSVPRLLRRLRPALAHFVHALPLCVPVPGGGHDPGPLLRARPVGDGHARPADLPRGRPPRRPARRAGARDLGADQARPVELYGIPEQKITVTPLAADPAFGPEGPSPDGEPYALFVGALQPRKEATTAIEALALIGEAAPRLVLVGPDKGGRAEAEETAARLGVPVELRGHIPQDELAALYRGAACLVFPQPLRGLRPAAARGDGLRHAGRRHHRRRAARGGRRGGDPGRARQPGRARRRDRARARRPRAPARGRPCPRRRATRGPRPRA